VSATAERRRFARIGLSFVAERGDPALGPLLRCSEPAEIVVALSCGDDPGTVLSAAGREIPGLTQVFRHWRGAAGSSAAPRVVTAAANSLPS
jgi:hypothetical protein